MIDFKKYLQNKIILDASDIMSPDIEHMQQPFAGESLFKFYPEESKFIFDKFSIRYTQKLYLNDPFELSKRWKDVASHETIKRIRAYFEDSLMLIFNDEGALRELSLKYLKDRGVLITPAMTQVVESVVYSDNFDIQKIRVLREMKTVIDKLIDLAFKDHRVLEDIIKRKFIDEMGIFSATESINNVQLWGLYASSGRGYAIELNAQSGAFLYDKGPSAGKSRFQKVVYTDDDSDSFIRNPLYLFLVKDRKWEFEQEWRIIKPLNNCNNINGNVFTDVLSAGSIRRIIFGYNFDQSNIDLCRSKIVERDAAVRFSVAQLDIPSRNISLRDL